MLEIGYEKTALYATSHGNTLKSAHASSEGWRYTTRIQIAGEMPSWVCKHGLKWHCAHTAIPSRKQCASRCLKLEHLVADPSNPASAMSYSSYASRFALFLLTVYLTVAAPVLAQEPAAYVLQPESELSVDGTSNTGHWTVNATELTGTLTMQAQEDAVPGLQDVQITIVAEGIKGRNMLMTKNMRRTLKVAEHKEILYTLKEVTESELSDGGAFSLVTVGDLTLGGVTKEIEMTVTGATQDDGQVHLTGSYSLLMSDYDLTDRRFMFGRFVLADEVTISYTAKFGAGE